MAPVAINSQNINKLWYHENIWISNADPDVFLLLI